MRWNDLDTMQKRFVAAVLTIVSLFICAVLIVNAVMDSRTRRYSSTDAILYTLSQSDKDLLTIHDTAGLPGEYHEIRPLYERFSAPSSKQSLGLSRVYPDGVVFHYEESKWSKRGKLQKQDLERLYELLKSDELATIFEKARQEGPCEHVGGGWRSYYGDEVREIAYSTSGEGGLTPDTLWDLSRIINQAY